MCPRRGRLPQYFCEHSFMRGQFGIECGLVYGRFLTVASAGRQGTRNWSACASCLRRRLRSRLPLPAKRTECHWMTKRL